MANKKKKKAKEEIVYSPNSFKLELKPYFEGEFEDISDISVVEFNETSIAKFGANILTYRMIPDLRDGLKPITRRLLYSAWFVASKNKVKSNGIIGELLKRWHPHGDVSAYTSMTKLCQAWRGIPLIDGKGNFGSVGDPNAYASMRYTEAKLSDFAKDCFFSDFFGKEDKEIVDCIPSFDDKDLEPFYLPAKYPVFMFNWGTGIGLGFQNNSPGFSLKDTLETTIKLIEEGFDAPVDINLDDPQGCDILAERGVKGNFFDTPDFKIRVRSKYHVETAKNADNTIVVTSLPFETSVTSIDSTLGDLIVRDKKIAYIKDTDDIVKNFKDLEYSIILNRGFDPHTCMEDLYKKTALEKSFSVSLHYVNDLKLKDYRTYRNALCEWIDYRRTQVKRKYKLKRSKLIKEVHIKEAYIWLIENKKVDEYVEIMKKNKSNDAKVKIMKQFSFTEMQSEALLSMRISNLNVDIKDKYIKDVLEIKKKLKEIDIIIHSAKKIDKIIVEELRGGIEKYGEPNKSKVHLIGGSIVKSASTNVEVTEKHFIKYGKKAIKSINTDTPLYKRSIPNTFMLAFNKKGNFSNINLGEIRDSRNNSVGYSFEDYGLPGKCVSIIQDKSKGSVVMITKNGIIQRSDIKKYNESKTGSAIKLKDGDKLVSAIYAGKSDSLFIITNKGNGLLIPVKDISETNRNTMGVTGIKLGAGEHCIGISRVGKDQNQIITITDRGYAKRFDKLTLPKSVRGGKGFKVISDNEKGNLLKIIGCSKDDKMEFYTNFNSETVEVYCGDVKKLTRMSKGTCIIKMPKSVKLVDVVVR